MQTPKVDELWRSGQGPTIENRSREAVSTGADKVSSGSRSSVQRALVLESLLRVPGDRPGPSSSVYGRR
jgi:hypothetical protein